MWEEKCFEDDIILENNDKWKESKINLRKMTKNGKILIGWSVIGYLKKINCRKG